MKSILEKIEEFIISIIQSINVFIYNFIFIQKNIICLFVIKQCNSNNGNDYYCFGRNNIKSISDYEKITKSLFDIVFKDNNKNKKNKIFNNDLKCIINYGNDNHLLFYSTCGCNVSILVNDCTENAIDIVNADKKSLSNLVFIINELLL